MSDERTLVLSFETELNGDQPRSGNHILQEVVVPREGGDERSNELIAERFLAFHEQARNPNRHIVRVVRQDAILVRSSPRVVVLMEERFDVECRRGCSRSRHGCLLEWRHSMPGTTPVCPRGTTLRTIRGSTCARTRLAGRSARDVQRGFGPGHGRSRLGRIRLHAAVPCRVPSARSRTLAESHEPRPGFDLGTDPLPGRKSRTLALLRGFDRLPDCWPRSCLSSVPLGDEMVKGSKDAKPAKPLQPRNSNKPEWLAQ